MDNSANAGVKRVWLQPIDATPGTEHAFEPDALATGAGYSLEPAINDTTVPDVFCPGDANVFIRHAMNLTPSSTPATVSIRNISGITFPSDFSPDDIAVLANATVPCNETDLADPRGMLDLADINASTIAPAY